MFTSAAAISASKCFVSPCFNAEVRCFNSLRVKSFWRWRDCKCRAALDSSKSKISRLSFVAAAFEILRSSSHEAFAGVNDPQCLGFAGENTSTFIVVACIVQAVALVGAAVGGTLARQRKQEVEKINAQLRQIFAKMRRQYQVENYAPALTYAPVKLGRSSDTPVDTENEQLMRQLRAGKQFLREKMPQRAFDEFQKALALSKQLDDKVEQKKAARGLGASCQRQGKFRDAIKYHTMVLTISHISGEQSGVTEALGAIADCYTELDDLENAAKYYDQYIARIDEE